MFPEWKSALVAAAGLAGVLASPTATSPAPVTLTQGIVHGTSTVLADTTVNKYLGIPYAHATRFERAVGVAASERDIDATQWGDKCPQTNTGSAAMLDGEVDDSEDCLFVNVYAPDTAASEGNKTVLVWIYGGGLQTGNSGRSCVLLYYSTIHSLIQTHQRIRRIVIRCQPGHHPRVIQLSSQRYVWVSLIV